MRVVIVRLRYLFYQIDMPTHDLQFIHAQIGLTKEAIQKLKSVKVNYPEYSNTLSALLEDDNFEYLLYLISKRFSYSIPSEEIKPIVKKENGTVRMENAQQYHESLRKREVQIPLDGSILLAKKKNLLDSLIGSALTDRMQNMAEAYKKIEREDHNG